MGEHQHLIGMFDQDPPPVGDQIDAAGQSWLVTEVVMVSRRWAAWGHVVEPTVTTVLIVDDELDMRLLVRTVIEIANEGLVVVGEAADGGDALNVWRGLGGPPVPDVVILDNRMPVLTGLEVARLILTERPEQLVVLYSAFLDPTVREEAAAIGIAACVSKRDLDELPGLVRSLVAA
jgi:CheY-like chemotaxis protein